jgi:hypothetical protein
MNVTVKQGTIEREPAEVLVLTHFDGDARLNDAAAAVDRACNGQLRELLKSGEFDGKLNQAVLLHTSGKAPAKRVLLVGLGKRKMRRWTLSGKPWAPPSSACGRPAHPRSSPACTVMGCQKRPWSNWRKPSSKAPSWARTSSPSI